MISEKLLKELNDQTKYEFASANYYLAMAAYCLDQDLDGFANFFKVQADEETFHAMKFFNFINDSGSRIVIQGFENPKNDFKSLEEVFSDALTHEKFVTQRINDMMEIAIQEKNFACVSFLNWFIDEQVEEESMFSTLLNKVRRIGNSDAGLFLLDAELAKRTFTPPAAE